MKRLLWIFAIISVASNVSHASDQEAINAAKTAVHSWLALTDANEFERSWTEASSLFQTAMSEPDWERALRAARSPLGELGSRELTSANFSRTLPGAPDGEYVVLTFASSFEAKDSAKETVTLMKDRDDKWRVSGYFIK